MTGRVLVIAALAGLALAGCNDPTPGPGSQTAAPAPPHYIDPAVIPPVRGEPIPAGDLTTSSCTVIPATDDLPASGSFDYRLQTSANRPMIYRFSIEVSDASGTVIGTRSVEVHSPPPNYPQVLVNGMTQDVVAPPGTHAVGGPARCRIVQATRSVD